MVLIDTHCHLYAEEFADDRDLMIERAKQAGVQHMYLPAIDSNHTESMLQVEAQHPGTCFAMMGLHPCYVNEQVDAELKHVQVWLDKRKFIAVGEIGLDHYWSTAFAAQQVEAFNQQMQWALEKDLPVVIHTRNAMQETIDLVKPFAAKGLKGVFHCFSGSRESAEQIIQMDFMLGIGGVITYKSAKLPEVIRHIPVEYLILETDAPYLTPVPHRGKRNESAYVRLVLDQVANALEKSPEEIALTTTQNALRLFKTELD